MTRARPSHLLALLAVAAAAPLLTGCDVELEPLTTDGQAAITWLDSPDAPVFNAPVQWVSGVTVETLANPTAPSLLACDPIEAPNIPGICDTHYQGRGFVIRPPQHCKRSAHLEIAGQSRDYGYIQKYLSATEAFYVTVSGPGTLTTPRAARPGEEFGDTFDTIHVPAQPHYDFRLTCEAGRATEATYLGHTDLPS